MGWIDSLSNKLGKSLLVVRDIKENAPQKISDCGAKVCQVVRHEC
jgi:hypothetical protein